MPRPGVNSDTRTSIAPRAAALFAEHQLQIFQRTDRMFAGLMVLQWLGGITAALVISPRAWSGSVNQTHLHVWAALLLGGAIISLPIVLALTRPGAVLTRHVIAVAQMLMSALLIHLSGGRIETHFHVFGSLAFLAFYRDWRVFVPATLVVALDHLLRGIYWPQSVYGVLTASPWRFVEHAAWVIFEDVFLTVSAIQSRHEMCSIAERQAELETTNEVIAARVNERTAELRASEANFRVFMDNSPAVAFMKDIDGRYVYINKAIEQRFSLNRADWLGKRDYDLWPTETAENIRKTDLAVLAQDRSSEQIETVPGPDGHSRYWLSYKFPVLNATGQRFLGGVAVEITDRVRADDALRASEAQKRAILENSLDAVITIDHEGRVTEFNQAAEKIFGYSRETAVGQRLDTLIIPPSLREAHRKGLTHYVATGEGPVVGKVIEVPAVRSDGSQFPLELAIIRVPGSKLPVFTAFARDITERKRGEESLKAFAARLEQSNGELQDFAYVASHDLQEPLRKIQAFGDRLKAKFAELLGDQGRDYLDRMHNAAARMQNLITDLLAFSRVSTKAQPPVLVDLVQTAHEVLADLETRIEQTGGRVEVGDLPRIEADPLQVRQLLQNLVGNALKFHREDETPVVKINGRILNGQNGASNGHNPRCEIVVEDNGIGFDEKYLDRIFNVFQRLHGRGKYEGTGVGLAICRKIVERHAGTITARSEPGKGATFIVTLPIKQLNGETNNG